jgi:AcrR family transcriptional regulator
MIEPSKINRSDPRAVRTRALLLQAFTALLTEKAFTAISVQDVAERATVNRATFYAHFEDKYALLDSFIRERFQQHLAANLVGADLSRDGLRALTFSVFSFFTELRGHNCTPADKLFDPLLQAAVQQSILSLLLSWLARAQHSRPLSHDQMEIAATAMSWAIFGATDQWSRTDCRRPPEGRIEQLVATLLGGVAGVLPDLFSQSDLLQSGRALA